ncbi:MAG: hypothetical protein IKZ13_00685 [Akkermansia sp.]|nr:hypothetical protein [Akkermansia sp.]
MKKIKKLLLTTVAILLTACGPATYDIENPEESVAKMLEPLTSAEKEKFVNAIGKITFKRIREENMSLMEFAKISKDPEKMKELMRCIDGKTVDEIIELAQ